MVGTYFEYDGESSEHYHLAVCSFETVSIPLGLNRNIRKGEVTRYRPAANHLGTSYSDVLSFPVSFVKADKASPSERSFTEEEVRQITAWLTSPQYPALFHMHTRSPDEKQYDYFGLFTEIEPFTPSGEAIYGFTAIFTANSPYAFTEEIIKTFASSSSLDFSITCGTDERLSPVYPLLLITPHVGTPSGPVTVQLTNHTDREQTLSLKLLKEPVTLDCSRTKILDQLGLVSFDSLGLSDVGYVYWPRLLYGENQFTLQGAADIQFRYREPRKVGSY